MWWKRRSRDEDGQASPEWVALLALIALLFLALVLAMHGRLPGVALGRSIVAHMLCAVRLSDSCQEEPELEAAYGADLARLVREQVPALAYEAGMTALPVDFRRCRKRPARRGRRPARSGAR